MTEQSGTFRWGWRLPLPRMGRWPRSLATDTELGGRRRKQARHKDGGTGYPRRVVVGRGLAGRSPPEVAGVVCSRAVCGTAVASRLAPRRARRGPGARWEPIGEGPRGGATPPGHGRCSFATRRGSPASDTLEPKRGTMQGLSAARTTRTGDVRWPATAPVRARSRAGRGLHGSWRRPDGLRFVTPARSTASPGRSIRWTRIRRTRKIGRPRRARTEAGRMPAGRRADSMPRAPGTISP